MRVSVSFPFRASVQPGALEKWVRFWFLICPSEFSYLVFGDWLGGAMADAPSPTQSPPRKKPRLTNTRVVQKVPPVAVTRRPGQPLRFVVSYKIAHGRSKTVLRRVSPQLTEAGAIEFYNALVPWTVDEVVNKPWLRKCMVPPPKARQQVCCACVALVGALHVR